MPGLFSVPMERYQPAPRSTIAGTEARVVLDREWVDEDCIYGTDPAAFSDVWANIDPEEVTYDWYAQDMDGNVWYFGQISKEFEDGELV